jgi:hypothetical protein
VSAHYRQQAGGSYQYILLSFQNSKGHILTSPDDADSITPAGMAFAQAADGWQPISATLTAPPHAHDLEIEVGGQTAPSTGPDVEVAWDTFKLEVLP